MSYAVLMGMWVEEVFPEIVDSVEEVVSDDGSKNLSGYSEHSRNCSNTAKDKEKAERGEHGKSRVL
uniref:Uncharacterized protein n=1 Tax=Magallana gigas TaxID=29159 RepID=K1S625_MAGGI